MRRQSDIEDIIVKLDQGLVLVQGSAIARAGVMPFPGPKTEGDRHITQNIHKLNQARL